MLQNIKQNKLNRECICIFDELKNNLKIKIMDLSTYEWPELSEVDLAFPTLGTDKELLAEAEKRNPAKGVEKFSELFFNGGKVKLKADVKGTWKEDAYNYARVLMGSWAPKHEHKELIVGMIFEECLILK